MEEVVLVDLLQDGDAATREYCAEAGRCDTLHRYRIVPVVPFAYLTALGFESSLGQMF